MKKNIVNAFASWLLPFALFLFLSPTSAQAEEVYQISAQELNQLNNNLKRLAIINSQQQQTLSEQNGLLKQAKFDLEELQIALKDCKVELTKAQSSLQTANELLEKYKNAEQKRRLRIKRQRNFAYSLATGLAIGLLYKR